MVFPSNGAPCCLPQGHGGAQPQDAGRPQDQRHAAGHRRGLRPVLAAAQRLQHALRLAPPGPPRLPARRHLLRLPPHRHGVHLHQPGGLRLPQQQLPEGAEGHAAALPVRRRSGRELREFPSVHGGQRRHHQGDVAQQDGVGVRSFAAVRDELSEAGENDTSHHLTRRIKLTNRRLRNSS